MIPRFLAAALLAGLVAAGGAHAQMSQGPGGMSMNGVPLVTDSQAMQQMQADSRVNPFNGRVAPGASWVFDNGGASTFGNPTTARGSFNQAMDNAQAVTDRSRQMYDAANRATTQMGNTTWNGGTYQQGQARVRVEQWNDRFNGQALPGQQWNNGQWRQHPWGGQ